MKLLRLIARLKGRISEIRIAAAIYLFFRKFFSVQNSVILLESHKGKQIAGNPFYLAEHILSSPEYSHFRVVIACADGTRRQFNSRKCVRSPVYCNVHSFHYYYYLATAAFLINDVTFPVFFSTRESQKYLNTWHGTPLKTLGRKTFHSQFLGMSNVQRNFLQSTHILAPNAHTEQTLLQDYMIEWLYSGSIVRSGYPRNDALVSAKDHATSDDFSIAFMPTWRGTFSTLGVSNDSYELQLTSLLSRLDADLPPNARLFVKLHPLVDRVIDLSGYRRIAWFPNDEEPYRFLGSCAALITDYSSVLFDFAATRRPIILYTPDLASYSSDRNFCLDIERLPFVRTNTIEELLHALGRVINGLSDTTPAAHQTFLNRYCQYDNGTSSRDLCDHFILGRSTVNHFGFPEQRVKQNLICLMGPAQSEPTISTIKSIVEQVDLSRFNVVLGVVWKPGQNELDPLYRALDERIHYMPIQSFIAIDPADGLRIVLQVAFGTVRNMSRLVRKLRIREFGRVFGRAYGSVTLCFNANYQPMLLTLESEENETAASVLMDLPKKYKHNFGAITP